METLRDLYIHHLKDLYSAEKQLTKALPKMAKSATNKQLASAFRQHNEQTKRQAKRLEDILKRHGESTRGPSCKGMEGLIAEGDEIMSESTETEVRDAGLISAAQRVEHYEIAGYGCARAYARMLGDKQGARLLDTSIQEEGDTDKKLTRLAQSAINLRAKRAKPTPKNEKAGGVARALKRVVKKVTG